MGKARIGHVLVPALSLVAACASNPNRVDPVPAPIASAVPAPSPSTPPPPPVATHAKPSDIVAPGATTGVHVDMSKVRASPAFAGALQSLDMLTRNEVLAFVVKSCGFSPIDVVTEAMYTHAPRRFVAAMTLNIPVQRALDCVRSVPRGEGRGPIAKEITVAGHRALEVDGLAVFEHDGMLVGVAGDDADATEALATEALRPGAPERPASLRERLALSGDTVVMLVDDEGEMASGLRATKLTASLRANGGEVAFDAHFERTTDGDEDVKRFTDALEGYKRMPKEAGLRDSAVSAAVTQMIDGVRYEANGRSRHFSMALRGDARVQAGAVTGLLAQAVGKYISAAKTAEARNGVGQIAHSLSAYAASQSTAATRRFPPSSSRVPASFAAIRGKKYMSSPADWSHASWQAIKFQMEVPQYYAYSFETSRDGKTVTIRAQGDLNGDGVLSNFELVGRLINGDVSFAPSLQETNPYE